MMRSLPSGIMLPVFALAFFAGVLGMQSQPELVPLYWSAVLFPVIVFCYYSRQQYWLIWLFSGFFWANLQGWQYLQSVVDESLAGQNILITGSVDDLAVRQTRSTKFRFNIESFELEGYTGPVPEYIRLSWYYSNVELIAGDRWQFVVRLKPPSGLQNPGGFDYEAWLYQQNIQATGYIRKHPLNKKLAAASGVSIVDRLRHTIRQKITDNAKPEMAALVNALAIGYRGDMNADIWQVLIKTGTNHLMAISGLHIGLIAGFVWFGLHQLARIKYLNRHIDGRRLLLLSFSAAFVYAALAGFTIPTQRALIMLAVVYTGLFFYRQLGVLHSLSAALIIVLFISPSCVLSVGFWLSFLAVAAISYGISGRMKGRNKVMLWLWPQIVVIVALMPLSLYFFHQASVIALVANLIAIPAVGLLILPVIMLALLLAPFFSALSSVLIAFSADSLSYLVMVLRVLSEYPFSVWVHSESSIISLLLALTGLLLLFSPYAFPARALSVLLLLPLFTSKAQSLPDNAFELHVLDVGQGLSVYIKTKDHNLLFDAGAKFSQRFDLGEKVVVPFLRNQGVRKLDRLIISNGDNDHIGGAQAVIDHIQTAAVIGRDTEKITHAHSSLCVRGQKWNWDGIAFEMLHPLSQDYKKRNNYSCVLKVSNAVNSVLITADIESRAEKELLKQQASALNATVLIVPHHGSNTSSSRDFLKAVNPKIAIYSSGYLNRYRFPHAKVVARYTEQGIAQLNTAKSGHISLIVDENSLNARALSYRQQYRRYWHRTTNSDYF
ncbi:MAG: DNA internalization-related competence protein ComEC/Rec2 [Gammaproteobacteria bacterium]|nr:DNA internalization-related competence protein ComEC/Rec2 [Gammaproteobacteria bacterium]